MIVRFSISTPVLCGPTAGGKSGLAVELAHTLRDRFNISAEIITADAFQVYRGLDIGTAKPTPEERRSVPHHLIDLVDPHAPGVRFTVQDWLTLAHRTIADIRARGSLPIVVGGTHLYIKALLDGLFEAPEPDPALRAQLAAMDPVARRAELERVDPQAAQRIHPNDTRRTIRALEIFRLTGKPISAHQTQWDQPLLPSSNPKSEIPNPKSPFLLTILDWDPEPLSRRINARVKQMFDRGLPSEVRSLLAKGDLSPQAAEALGYKQLIPAIRAAAASGGWPPPAQALEAAAEAVKIETRRFAKNQRTWLRRLRARPGTAILPMPVTTTADAARAILDRLESTADSAASK